MPVEDAFVGYPVCQEWQKVHGKDDRIVYALTLYIHLGARTILGRFGVL